MNHSSLSFNFLLKRKNIHMKWHGCNNINQHHRLLDQLESAHIYCPCHVSVSTPLRPLVLWRNTTVTRNVIFCSIEYKSWQNPSFYNNNKRRIVRAICRLKKLWQRNECRCAMIYIVFGYMFCHLQTLLLVFIWKCKIAVVLWPRRFTARDWNP